MGRTKRYPGAGGRRWSRAKAGAAARGKALVDVEVLPAEPGKALVEVLVPAPEAAALVATGRDMDFKASFPVEDLVAAFLAGRSARTMAAYRGDLQDFAAWLGVATVEAVAGELLGCEHGPANALALQYRARLVERGLAAATCNRRLAALRSLVKLGRTLGIVKWALEVPSLPAQAYRDTRGPGADGFLALLVEARKRNDGKGRRDVAILRLLFDLALRRSEVASLDVGHVDLDAGKVDVLGKGRSGREKLTLPAPTCEVLTAWLAVRGTEPGPLFVSYHPDGRRGRLSATSINRVINGLAARAGLRATPHGLRHASITSALDLSGGDVRRVAKFSRHKDVRTVELYDDNREDQAGQIAGEVAGAVPNPGPAGAE